MARSSGPLRAAHEQPGHRSIARRRRRPQRRREPRPARHPDPAAARGRRRPGRATRCWRARRSPACTSIRVPWRAPDRHLHGRARRRRRAWSSRSPTWRPPTIAPEHVDGARDLIADADWLVLDGNLSAATLAYALDWPTRRASRCVLDPVSVAEGGPDRAATSTAVRVHALTPTDRRARRADRPPTRRAPRRGRRDAARRAASRWSGCGSACAGSSLFRAGRGPGSGGPTGRGRRSTSPAPATRCSRRSVHALLPAEPTWRAAAYGHAAAALYRRQSATPSDPTSPTALIGRRPGGSRVNPLLRLTDEVATPSPTARPVVALESTIISHGMPYPQNVAMATRGRGHHPRARRGAGDDRGARRRAADRARRPTTSSCSASRRRRAPRSASATCRTSSPAASTARPPSPRRCGWPRWPASGSSSPAASAACTAAPQQTFDVSADLTELVDDRRSPSCAPA